MPDAKRGVGLDVDAALAGILKVESDPAFGAARAATVY
jgi:hypothetical protein